MYITCCHSPSQLMVAPIITWIFPSALQVCVRVKFRAKPGSAAALQATSECERLTGPGSLRLRVVAAALRPGPAAAEFCLMILAVRPASSIICWYSSFGSDSGPARRGQSRCGGCGTVTGSD